MTITITQAIRALGGTQFIVEGTPTNETQYKANVKYISGEDSFGSSIFKDTQDFTWSQVLAKQTELQTTYDNNEYQRKRETAYPTFQEFAEAYCEKEIGGDSTKWDAYKTAYNKVRTDNPKG